MLRDAQNIVYDGREGEEKMFRKVLTTEFNSDSIFRIRSLDVVLEKARPNYSYLFTSDRHTMV